MSNRSKTEIIIIITIITMAIVGIVVENSKHESGVLERLYTVKSSMYVYVCGYAVLCTHFSRCIF